MASEQLSFNMEEFVQWHYVLRFYYRVFFSDSKVCKKKDRKNESYK